ncbi:arylamine N-acetyltransferase family protein [Salinactinospora qingdaonensis]|uniref:Arylamine N-acetyltransferase n=1 Tax=Salinactinospora qingdaonensis TaxID=702744 RepID=A0ABP7GKN4_9ACTN
MSPDLWQTDELDLDAYLARIGVAGSLPPDDTTLARLHEAHASTIPFENLDVVLGHGVSLHLPDIVAKLVARRRGGYCFEHMLLFTAALERLGFTVARLLARVFPDAEDQRAAIRTHMTAVVYTESGAWLSDVGFGASTLAPIRLAEGAILHQAGASYRIDRSGSLWTLSTQRDDAPSSALHAFTLEPQRPSDYEVANHYTATHPNSPFVERPVVIRPTPVGQHRLHDDRLTLAGPEGPAPPRRIDRCALPGVLREVFGIVLSEDDIDRLRQLPVFEESS